MEQKGCGCLGYLIAVMAGVVLGVAGLLVFGYVWANASLLSDGPMQCEQTKWGVVDEAALTVKLSPVLYAIKRGNESEHEVTLSPKEVNQLLQAYPLPELGDPVLKVQCGDTLIRVRYSKCVFAKKYMNGMMRARVSGTGGDFKVSIKELHTGKVKWPKALLPQAAKWLEGLLETQNCLKDEHWRLEGIEQKNGKIKALVKVEG